MDSRSSKSLSLVESLSVVSSLLGIRFKEKYYIDIASPFGCRTSALACARATRAVVWLLRQDGFFSLCYLDDCVGIESTKEKADEAYAKFISYSKKLGLQLALDKCTPPDHTATWLGFCINTVDMSIKILVEKLNGIISECTRWKEKETATRKQLQSLAGKLQHLTKCIKPASRFTNRVLAVL